MNTPTWMLLPWLVLLGLAPSAAPARGPCASDRSPAPGPQFAATDLAPGDDALVPTCPPHDAIKGDDRADDTAALQAFLDANRSARLIRFPAGRTFKITSQLTLRGWSGGLIDFNGSTLKWYGASDATTCGQRPAPVSECHAYLKLEASYGVTVRNLILAGDGAHAPGYGIYIGTYRPHVLQRDVHPGSTVVNVDFDPTDSPYRSPGTAHFQDGWDEFAFTGIGTSPGACGGAGPYCFTGVSGISHRHAAGGAQYVWFMRAPQAPAFNVIEHVEVRGNAASVAGFQNGWNGRDGRCNSADDPFNLDQNQFIDVRTPAESFAAKFGFRQEAITAAGTYLLRPRVTGTASSYRLECGNSAKMDGVVGLGGSTLATPEIYIGIAGPPPAGGGGIGTLTIEGLSDSELNRPFLYQAPYAGAEVRISSAVFRAGAHWVAGTKIIEFLGSGSLTLDAIAYGFNTTSGAPPAVVKVGPAIYGATTFVETAVTGHGVVYQVDPSVNWTRNGSYHYQRVAPGQQNTPWPYTRLITTRSGGHATPACAEWQDGNAASTGSSLWRLCHAQGSGAFFLQHDPTRKGLATKHAVAASDTAIRTVDASGKDADPTAYGFLGTAACGGGCRAMLGGPEAGYFVTFTYTGAGPMGGGAYGFSGVSGIVDHRGIGGYAPAGTPIVNNWLQQVTAGIVQQWTPAGVIVTPPLTVGAGAVGSPGLAFAGDPNTGFYHGARADQFAATAGGTTSLGFQANGVSFGGLLDAPSFVKGTGLALDPGEQVGWGRADNVTEASRDYLLVRGGSRSYLAKALIESSPTGVFQVASGAGGHLGVTIEYTIIARDRRPEVQTRHGTVQLAAAQTTAGAAPTCVVGGATETVAASAGTLTGTWTCVPSSDRITARLEAVSSLSQTVLEVRYQVRVNASAGHGAMTPL